MLRYSVISDIYWSCIDHWHPILYTNPVDIHWLYANHHDQPNQCIHIYIDCGHKENLADNPDIQSHIPRYWYTNCMPDLHGYTNQCIRIYIDCTTFISCILLTPIHDTLPPKPYPLYYPCQSTRKWCGIFGILPVPKKENDEKEMTDLSGHFIFQQYPLWKRFQLYILCKFSRF